MEKQNRYVDQWHLTVKPTGETYIHSCKSRLSLLQPQGASCSRSWQIPWKMHSCKIELAAVIDGNGEEKTLTRLMSLQKKMKKWCEQRCTRRWVSKESELNHLYMTSQQFGTHGWKEHRQICIEDLKFVVKPWNWRNRVHWVGRGSDKNSTRWPV